MDTDIVDMDIVDMDMVNMDLVDMDMVDMVNMDIIFHFGSSDHHIVIFSFLWSGYIQNIINQDAKTKTTLENTRGWNTE